MERQRIYAQKSATRPHHFRRQSTGVSSPAHPLLGLQRSIGNRAFGQLIGSTYIQAKLKLSTPGDASEQEADRVADAVMRMPEPRGNGRGHSESNPPAVNPTRNVQRESQTGVDEDQDETAETRVALKPVPLAIREDDEEEEVARFPEPDPPEEHPDRPSESTDVADIPLRRQTKDEDELDETVQRLCTECEEEAEVQKLASETNRSSTPTSTTSLAANIRAMDGGGSPLSDRTRAFFEQRFGSDFSGVRVHTNSHAVDTAKSINARAFTFGRNIAFGSGEYSPDSSEGRHILAHELTHVLQQREAFAGPPSSSRISTLHLTPIIQRQPAKESNDDDPAIAAQLDQETQAWEKNADQDADLMLRAKASRMVLLLKGWSRAKPRPPLKTADDLDKFVAACTESAKTEMDTLALLTPAGVEAAFMFYPKGFPLTWSGRIQSALTLGVDPAAILAGWNKAYLELAKQATALGPEIFEHGLPVPFDDLSRLDDFHLRIADSKLEKGAIRDYAVESIRYMQVKFVSSFAFMWENLVNQIAGAVADGKVVPSYVNWKDFVDNKQAILRDLPTRARERLVKSEEEGKEFQDTVVDLAKSSTLNLADAALLTGLVSGLTGLFGILGGWTQASALFDSALENANSSVARSGNGTKVLNALQYAWHNNYFRGAAAAFVQNLIDHGVEILGEIALIIVLGMIPGVNLAVEAYLLLTTARDVVGMLDALAKALNQVMDAKSVGELQKASAKLTEVLVNGAIQIMIVLATLGIAKAAGKIRKRAGELMAADKELTPAAAERKALEELSAAERKPLQEAAQKVEELDRRYHPDTKPILDTPGVRTKLAQIGEEARSLLELCGSPCLPPASQILEADLKLLEQTQKRLGRPGYDRGLKEYFYGRRKAPGGLKKAIEDLSQVKKSELQKFLDAEIVEGRPPGTSLSRDAKGRFVLDRGPNAPKGTVRVITEYDVRPYGQHSPMTDELGGFFQSHHGIQDAWAQRTGVPGYDRNAAQGILLRDRHGGSPHQTITARQNARRGDVGSRTYLDERKLMRDDLKAAEVPPDAIDRAVAANDKYFGDLYKKALKDGYTPKDLEAWFGTWKPK